MFCDFLLQDSFAEIYFRDNQNAKSSNFSRMTLVYIAADIGCFFITRVVFRNILLIVRLTYAIDFVNTYVLEFYFILQYTCIIIKPVLNTFR